MILVLFLGLFFHASPLRAQEMNQELASKASLDDEEESVIDTTHKRLSSSLFYFSNQIDSFFGGERADDLPNGSRVRLLLNFNKEESSSYKTKGALKINIALVETQKKLKISFRNQYEKTHDAVPEKKDVPNDPVKLVKPLDPAPSEEESSFNGLRDFFKWRLRLDSGIQLDFPPDPFLRLSAIKSWNFGTYELRATQQIFYYLKSGAGETSKLDLDHPITENVLFRYENDATWTDLADRFTFFSGPIIYQKIGDQRGISYNLKVFGESKPTWYVKDYRLEVTYRRAVLKRWFFLELNPYIHFPKDKEWRSALGFNLRLELVVGSY